MKTIKLFLAASLILITNAASAQFANSNTSTSGTMPQSSSRNVDTNGWQRISLSYNPLKITSDKSDVEDINGTGIAFEYTKGISIAKEFPIFLEIGVNAMYSFYKVDEDEKGKDYTLRDGTKAELKYTHLALKVPVNLAYKFSLSNKNISIIPYVGINFKGNLLGKAKHKLVDDLDEETTEKEFWQDYEENYAEEYGISGREESNLFDKKETGNKDATWKRFQMGWQLGVGLYYNQLYVGVGYGKDITELCKKTKIGTTSITLGYSF